MNTDPADTRYPHLDLEDLIAGAAGHPIGDQAREHLARCEHCRREANRWNLVADGVRDLAAAAPGTAQPARPRRTGQHVLAGPWRRAMLVAGSAAAALVLLVGVGTVTGLVHVHLSGPSTQTVLTAVTGCTQIEQADGTLEQVNGSSLVITTASGQPVTVTTTATTFVSMSGPLLSDITDGAVSHGARLQLRRDDQGRHRHRRTTVQRGEPARLRPCPGDSIGRERRRLHPRDIQRNPDPGDHLRPHARRHTPRQPGRATGRRHHRRRRPRRTGRDAVGTSSGSGLAAAAWCARRRLGAGLLAQVDRRSARNDQRGARPRPADPPDPDDGWHRYLRGASHRMHEQGRTAYPSGSRVR